MLIHLYESENNGYHDSDFFSHALNTETIEIEKILIGTTRGAGCSAHHFQCCFICNNIERVKDLSPYQDLIEQAKDKAHARQVAKMLENPRSSNLHKGIKVQLKDNVRNKNCTFETCPKCNGSGDWTNPNRSHDVRDCFACKALGVIITKGTGMTTFPALTNGVVLGKQTSTFGYHRKETIIIKTDSGQLVRTEVERLRML